jgi:predicted Zn finger-like uncharacterized protein
MLFTRCPECETTFRVTDETLKKANGQVRCGRCASVFNAYAELHDPTAKSFEPEAERPRSAVEQDADPPAPASAPPAPPAESKSVEPNPGDSAIGAASVADVVAEAKVAAADSEADVEPQPDMGAISPTEVDRVLTTTVNTPLPPTAYAWPAAANADARASRWWSAAAALALVALAAQALHHFRSELAGHSTFGPILAQVYGVFGAELAPSWDVRQYEIIDWVATAEPNSRGLGSLKITARIQNRGPQRQPYPAVQLRLKDRWEEAVGSRMFGPAEYLPRDTPRGRLMSPGETARAEIEVVDPGPDAYGFELDVCIEVEASLVTCGTDKVFL